MKRLSPPTKGYTLIELMMVVAILATITSIVIPRFDVLLQRANQSKSRSNLGVLRSGLASYYSETDGFWPLGAYPQGDSHTADGFSLTSLLVPRHISSVATPKLHDRMTTFNGLSQVFDESAEALMSMTPPKDAYIIWGPQDYTPMLASPYAYNNRDGVIYIPNGNYSVENKYFYLW